MSGRAEPRADAAPRALPMILEEFGLEDGTSLEGLCYGLIVRSHAASGTIQSIHIPTPAPDLTVLGARDIPGENRFELFGAEMPLLAQQQVRYPASPFCFWPGRRGGRWIDSPIASASATDARHRSGPFTET